jgi:copper oxidase (laccase) domain-containing protein
MPFDSLAHFPRLRQVHVAQRHDTAIIALEQRADVAGADQSVTDQADIQSLRLGAILRLQQMRKRERGRRNRSCFKEGATGDCRQTHGVKIDEPDELAGKTDRKN